MQHTYIDNDDLKKLRSECKQLFLNSNPKFVGLKLSDRFMLKKIIDFYLK